MTGRASSPRVTGAGAAVAARPESAPVRRPYVPRASRLTPTTPVKAQQQQEGQPQLLELRPQQLELQPQPRVSSGTATGRGGNGTTRWS